MDYRRLGNSGLRVSPLCLGTMVFGDRTDEKTAARIVGSAMDAGVNFIDTADAYANGASEAMVGKLIASRRNQWVLATKVANPLGHGPNGRGVSRKWIMQAVEASLKRLATDYIDVYYLHKEDHGTPLAETVRVMADLIRAGKVRYFGVSNYRSWRIAEICNLCDRFGIDRPVVSQPHYNALNREAEVEHLPACGYYGLGVAPYSPLARGVLTGKYVPGAAPDKDSRAGRNDTRMMQTEWRPESLAIAQDMRRYAEVRGISAGQFAIAWLLNHRLVSSVVTGPRTQEQWDDYMGALGYRFTAEDEAMVDRLVAAGRSSTPGHIDPSYPVEGRMPLTA